MDNIVKLRPELFGKRCDICGRSTLYADNMTIMINTTKKTTVRTAMKKGFLKNEFSLPHPLVNEVKAVGTEIRMVNIRNR